MAGKLTNAADEITLADPPHGQRRILARFKGQDDIVFAPGDMFELRICCAMAAKGIFQRYEEAGEFFGYELTPAGRASLTKGAQ